MPTTALLHISGENPEPKFYVSYYGYPSKEVFLSVSLGWVGELKVALAGRARC